jgi:hypothetical protein
MTPEKINEQTLSVKKNIKLESFIDNFSGTTNQEQFIQCKSTRPTRTGAVQIHTNIVIICDIMLGSSSRSPTPLLSPSPLLHAAI